MIGLVDVAGVAFFRTWKLWRVVIVYLPFVAIHHFMRYPSPFQDFTLEPDNYQRRSIYNSEAAGARPS
jgi:hypothetical protein